MSDVFFKLSAEEKQVVDAMMKIIASQTKVEDGFKKIKKASVEVEDSTKKISDAAKAGGTALVDNMAPGLLKLTTLAGAAVMAVDGVNALIEKGKERAKEMADQIERLRGELAKSGQVSLMPKLEKQIKEMSQQQLFVSRDDMTAQAGILSGKFGTDLSTDQIVKALQYGVAAKRGGLDPNVAEETIGQLMKVFKDGDHGSAAGQLLSQGFHALDSSEMVEAQRFAAGGKSLEEFLPHALAGRSSGENAKIWESIREDAGAEITTKDLQPMQELPAASQARLREIAERKVELEAERVGMETAGNTKSTRAKRRLHEMEIENKQLGLESDTLNLGKVDVWSDEQQRKTRMNAIPQEQREAAILADPTLSSSKNKSKIANYAAALNEFRKNGATDIVAKAVVENIDLEETEQTHSDAKTLRENLVEKQNRESKNRENSGLQTEVMAQEIEKIPVLGKVLGYAFRGKRALGNAIGFDGLDDIAQQGNTNFVPEKKPQEVIVKEDQSQVKRIQPSRHGGDSDKSGMN